MNDADRRARIEQLLEGYFDLRTNLLVERVMATATPEELDDDAAMAALFAEFVALLRERYDRADPGWSDAAEQFLAAEWSRRLEEARVFQRQIEDG